MQERWRHRHGCGRCFNAVRDTVTEIFVLTYKVGEPNRLGEARRTADKLGAGAIERWRLPHRRRLRRADRPRGRSPRQAGSTSPSTAALPRLSRRHAGVRADRQRRPSGGPYLQVSPAARHPTPRAGRAERPGRVGQEGPAQPNIRATVEELHEGLRAESQNSGPSSASTSARSATPCRGSWWRASTTRRSCGRAHARREGYERKIRAAAGSAARRPSRTRTATRRSTPMCDVLIVGAGPAGLAAALAAGETGGG